MAEPCDSLFAAKATQETEIASIDSSINSKQTDIGTSLLVLNTADTTSPSANPIDQTAMADYMTALMGRWDRANTLIANAQTLISLQSTRAAEVATLASINQSLINNGCG